MKNVRNHGFSKIKSVVTFLAVFCIVLSGPASFAKKTNNCKCCSKTAQAVYTASLHDALDDFWITTGNALNLEDSEAASELLTIAKEEKRDAYETAKEQKRARLEICEKLGEEPYDPVINPNDFVDFAAVIAGEESFTPNPFFPLTVGSTWEYQTLNDSNEVIETGIVEVLAQTNEILGVNCIVVRDRVWEIVDGNEILLEDTIDWFGQKKDSTVWYFGEISQNFVDGELNNLEGSWKAGEDFAKPGIIMPANPQKGDFYRQEFAIANAEDVAKVISRGEKIVTVPAGTFDTDVLKTRDWTPIEPDVFERKFYAPGTGLILTVNPVEGERVELINVTIP